MSAGRPGLVFIIAAMNSHISSLLSTQTLTVKRKLLWVFSIFWENLIAGWSEFMENSYGKIPATDSKQYIATIHKYTLFTIISNKILHKKFKYLYYYSNLFNTLYIIVKFRSSLFIFWLCFVLRFICNFSEHTIFYHVHFTVRKGTRADIMGTKGK